MKKIKKEKYALGIDIGIASTGWGLLALDENGEPKRIIDAGSLIFTAAETPKTGEKKAAVRRGYRGTRRVIRRREYRLDRVRRLLNEYGLLGTDDDFSGLLPSEVQEKLSDVFENMVGNYYKGRDITPYDLKVKGLDEALSNDEVSIILCHYAKHRGYKSNREEEKSDDKGSENGKVKSAISENEKLMASKKYRSVSEMLLKDEKFSDGIRNSSDSYRMSVTREMYEKEIDMVLSKQVELGVLPLEFKEKYLEIWGNQREYYKGPGYYYVKKDGATVKKISPYGSETSLITRMVGTCDFDGNPRAPKQAPSAEMFVLVQRLLNLRYKVEGDYRALSAEEIRSVLDTAVTKKELKYKDVTKVLGFDRVTYKNNSASKSGYKKACDKLAKELGEEKIEVSKLSEEGKERFNEILDAVKADNVIYKWDGYVKFKDHFSKWNPLEWDKIKEDYRLLDKISVILTNFKTDEDVKAEVLKARNIPDEYAEVIVDMPTFKNHIRLSLEAIYEVLPLMISGKRYDEAASEVFGDFREPDYIKRLDKDDTIKPLGNITTNQLVEHSLAEARKVINAIIKKYGLPERINIETARELAKDYDERREIEKRQQENFEKNMVLKQKLISYGYEEDKISGTDLLKYKLWEEQGEFCPYTLKKITVEDIKNNCVEIDHILPYSRTFDDSFLNKTLVFSSANQEKKQKTPYEWMGSDVKKWGAFKNFIKSSATISDRKKDIYLLEDLTDEIAGEMRSQNLNDTKYIAKALASFLKANLDVKEVNMFSGSMTGKLRGRWGLNGLATSFESPTYYVKRDTYDEVKKNRDCNLHHAMDGLVIASMNRSLEMKVSAYETIYRSVARMTSEELEQVEKETELLFDDYVKDDGIVNDEALRKYIDDCIAFGKKVGDKSMKYKGMLFPQPYEGFAKEAKVRLYERDLDVIKDEMKDLGNYTTEDIDNLKVIYPVKVKPKASGAMHKETFYGVNKEKGEKYNRIGVDKLTLKNIDNVADKDGGAKAIFNVLIEWMGGNDGSVAFKEKGYPINPGTGKPIKKVKMVSSYTPGKGHIISENINGKTVEKFVEGENIHVIDVYKSKDEEDDKLYFVGYDLFDLANIKKIAGGADIDFDVQLWYGRDKNNIVMKYSELMDKFDLLLNLPKNQLVYIELKDGKKSMCYINGFTSGQLEVDSVTGDGYDICGEQGLFNKVDSRYRVTISTIKSIKKLEITKLGEISGL